MIREFSVHAAQFNLRHVTRRTVLRTHRTAWSTSSLSLRVFGLRQVTRKTLRVVIRTFLLQLLVGIVTSQTPYSRIIGIVPATIEHPVRLKANIVDRRLTGHEHRLLKTRVARSAEGL